MHNESIQPELSSPVSSLIEAPTRPLQPARDRRTRLKQILWSPEPAPEKPLTKVQRRQAVIRQYLWPLGLYFLLTLVLTFPLVLHFGTRIHGDGGDAWQNVWNFWWTNKALTSLHNPFTTDYLYAPYGTPLYLHSLNLFNALVSLPVQWVFGPVAAYNSVVLLSFTLAGFWAYRLVTFLCKNALAGFVGGVIYAFSSYGMTQLFLGQSNLFASEWLPAYVLGLIGANSSQGRKRTLYAFLALVSLVFTMLCDWQYVIFCAIFTGLYTLYLILARRSWKPLLLACLIGLGFLVIASPLIWRTYVFINSGLAAPTYDSFVRAYSADLFSFFIPSPRQSLWGSWAAGVGGDLNEISHNKAIFLGVLPVVLAAIGVWYSRRKSLFWLGLALVGFVLALGPMLQMGGVLYPDIKLPFQFFQIIPGVNVARTPVRYVLLVVLALAVLSGYGLAGWLARPLRSGSKGRLLASGLLVGLLLAEHIAIPFPGEEAQKLPFYQQLGASAEPGTILEIPYTRNRAISLYQQTQHQHPIIGGYLSREIDYPVLDLPPLKELPNADGKDITVVKTSEAEIGRHMMQYAGIRWIVIRLRDPLLNRPGLPKFIEQFAQPTPLYQDADMIVYRPQPPTEPALPRYTLEIKGGWHEPEPFSEGPTHRMRWFERRGGIYGWNISDRSQNVSFDFDVWSFHQDARRLAVRVDGSDVGTWTVKDLQHFSLPLTLTPGRHQIELRSTLDPPQSPASLGLGSDQRLLSFGVSNLELKQR